MAYVNQGTLLAICVRKPHCRRCHAADEPKAKLSDCFYFWCDWLTRSRYVHVGFTIPLYLLALLCSRSEVSLKQCMMWQRKVVLCLSWRRDRARQRHWNDLISVKRHRTFFDCVLGFIIFRVGERQTNPSFFFMSVFIVYDHSSSKNCQPCPVGLCYYYLTMSC